MDGINDESFRKMKRRSHSVKMRAQNKLHIFTFQDPKGSAPFCCLITNAHFGNTMYPDCRVAYTLAVYVDPAGVAK